ncbi:DUF4349 domain-containing protein [Gracilibacillus alcaliphilus]|uniref:DUF4349 domain-containing protein n=1 Tax=Gracilibacillus alcaliphilus TaxID=1401441 RepID=UPI0019594D5F|nr:DUF4349 domain-containing protein [Gracilibacillus alcaliphilus]MBM7679652.1 hypothetical protein [Gracilibacillus alcaliphilus]
MKKITYLLLVLIFWVSACSHSDQAEPDKAVESADTAFDSGSASSEMEAVSEAEIAVQDDQTEPEEPTEGPIDALTERKIIYNGNLRLETNQFDETMTFLEEETKKYQGYIVHSTVSNYADQSLRYADLTVRIPAEDFETFMGAVEAGNIHILEKSTDGQDVTEHYVDLKARLASKEVVEDRLLIFMEEAEKTEDLLTISNDLAAVQEEIEQLKGQIQYLDNQSDFATIQIYLTERDVSLPSVSEESLTTWEKTKEQFINSLQTLLSFTSGLFIFIVGNAPIIGLIIIAIGIIYFFIKRTKKRKTE